MIFGSFDKNLRIPELVEELLFFLFLLGLKKKVGPSTSSGIRSWEGTILNSSRS